MSQAPTASQEIALVDLRMQHLEIEDEVREGMERVMQHVGFVGGPEVAAFETEFADFCGARHCVGVGNGTDALELLLRAVRIGVGDEVVLPANSFVATAEAVVRAGAAPVLADVDANHLLLDPEAAARAVGPRTRALLPVHLYGQVAPMEALRDIAHAHKILLLEDAAQAHGARRHGNIAGHLATGAAFSFYPGKNLGAYGDAGAITTDDDAIAGTLRAVRDHGSTARYVHTLLGFNSRLDTVQAVVLSAKLRRLARWNRERQVAAARYDAMLADATGVVRPAAMAGNEHVWHLYVVRVPRRDAVLTALREHGIGAGVHYPRPIHLQPAFAHLGYSSGDFPVTEAAAARILSLPIFPGITEDQQERVVSVLRSEMAAAA